MKYTGGMTTQKYDDSLYWLMLQVSIRAKHDVSRLADAHELTVMQLITLCSLWPGEPVPMNSISCLLVCDASNVTGIVDRLVQRGYILRQESAEDRRVKQIRLTEKGETLRAGLIAEIVSAHPPSMDVLDKDEREMLRRLLVKVLTPPTKQSR